MIYIGADHQGYKLKQKIKRYLNELGFEYKDMGAYEFNKQDDYPDFAKAVCKKLGKGDAGILICATGIGMSIAANKFKGIRAALCCNAQAAQSAREHNNANILCLCKNADYKKIVRIFLSTKFKHFKRHVRRLSKIADF